MIQHRLNPTWGSADLVQASRFLLWEAFRDPSNERFILLSESDLPLFHPLVFYRQVMGEEKSRANAWPRPAWQMDLQRWTWRMAMPPYNIRQSMWRKSSQFFSLIRSHAELILRDYDVFRGFQEYCKSGWDGDYNKWRDCYTDEHYIPTLFAMHNKTDETFEEVGSGTFADWSQGGPHPREYAKNDVSVELFGAKLGMDEACLSPNLHRKILLREVEKTFVRLDDMNADGEKTKSRRGSSKMKHQGEGERAAFLRSFLLPQHPSVLAFAPPLKSTCFVTTRKFGPDTVDTVLDKVFLDCGSNGLSMLNKDVCKRAAAERAEQRRWKVLENMALDS
jgi:Core-2/I-Branching enzyme